MAKVRSIPGSPTLLSVIRKDLAESLLVASETSKASSLTGGNPLPNPALHRNSLGYEYQPIISSAPETPRNRPCKRTVTTHQTLGAAACLSANDALCSITDTYQNLELRFKLNGQDDYPQDAGGRRCHGPRKEEYRDNFTSSGRWVGRKS